MTEETRAPGLSPLSPSPGDDAAARRAVAEAARARLAKAARKKAKDKAKKARRGDNSPIAVEPAAEAARPPASRRRRFLRVLAVLGPGLIAANAGNDAGGIVTYAAAGAEFGYRTLFFMVLVTVALVVVQEMCSRLGVYTGKGLGALIREEFSLRAAAFALTCLIVANVGLVVSEFAGIGAALELFGVSRYLSVPISAVAIWALVLFGSYRYAERIFLALSLVFFAYPVAAVLAHPKWSTVGSQLVWPHFLASSRFLLLGVALIGTTITPYMQLYVAAAVADKGISPDDYGYSRIDSVGGAIFGNVISMVIIIATAAATVGHRGTLADAGEAAKALKPVAGSFASDLFGVGLFGASALAGAVVPLSTAYAISEALGVERSVSRRFREAPVFLGLFTGQVAIGAAIALLTSNLVQLLLVTQVLNGLITPVILAFILVMANRRSLLGDAANGPAFRVVSTICVGLVGALSLIVLIQTIGQLVGF
ncbi:MAG: Nramp family divalent metal transporter [Acidimicrobiales bacterium]